MNTSKRLIALLAATAFLTTGCAQLSAVPLTRTDQGVARPAVNAGDRVVVTTQDGAKHRFQVTAVESDALRGDTDRVAYADMKSLQVQGEGMRISKTAVIVGAVVLAGVAAAAAGGGGGGGGGY
jgi:hypothetical protein